tara:strand:- start:709 stop:1146 length:438 start_codon:yes stop_codon:yes gene_type:complete
MNSRNSAYQRVMKSLTKPHEQPNFHMDGIITRFPSINMVLKDNWYIIDVELAGFLQENITLKTQGRTLIIEATNPLLTPPNPSDNDTVLLQELKRDNVYRCIYIPFSADLDNISPAIYKNGILHIRIPISSIRFGESHTIPIQSI